MQRQFLGLQNNSPVTNIATDLPALPLAESDEEKNDPDVPHLPLTNSDYEESDAQACQLPLVDIGEEEKISDDMSVTSQNSTLDLGSQVKKLFQGLGWFSGEVVETFLDDRSMQMYTIRFTDDEE